MFQRELKESLSKLGFFKFQEKKSIQSFISTYEGQIGKLKADFDSFAYDCNIEIDKIKAQMAYINPKVGEIVKLGREPFSNGDTPLEWKVVGNDGTIITLLSVHTLDSVSYYQADKWLKENFVSDTFTETDDARLTELLGDGYVPFTEAEVTELEKVVGGIISRDFFMDYFYALDNSPEGKMQTEWFNPTTLDRNVYLHAWLVISTSPFANALFFVTSEPGITSVALSPNHITISAGLDVQLTPAVVTTGFANKSVQYQVVSAPGEQEDSHVTVSVDGKVHVPSDYTPTTEETGPIVIRAVSVFDSTKYGDAEITVV